MSPDVQVTQVLSRADHRAFWTLPYRLHGNFMGWPAPLRREERRRWDPAHNPALHGRSVWRFVARADGKVVGRIAAFHDPDFAARWSPDTGGFGCFESIDIPAVAGALLAAAEDVLRSHGVTRVLGPVGLTFHDEMGLLVDGFEAGPSLLTPCNPPHYGALIERHGYRPCFDQHAYEWRADVGLHPVVARAARGAAAAGILVRQIRPAEWDAEVARLHALYNAAFADVWGFVPIAGEDFRARANGFRAIHWPELVLFAEHGGTPVGFAIALPDISPLLAASKGRLWPLGALRLALGAARVRRVRLMLLGVEPCWKASGAGAALVAELVDRGKRLGLAGGELSLVHESNRAVRRLIIACGGTRTKTFRVYGKML